MFCNPFKASLGIRVNIIHKQLVYLVIQNKQIYWHPIKLLLKILLYIFPLILIKLSLTDMFSSNFCKLMYTKKNVIVNSTT